MVKLQYILKCLCNHVGPNLDPDYRMRFTEPDFITTGPDFYIRHISSVGLLISLKKLIWYIDKFICQIKPRC